MSVTAARCQGVTKIFQAGDQRVPALRGIDVDFPTGELILLVGPSGCGKTTLISIIAGLLDPSEGRVELLGRPRDQLEGEELVRFRRENVGFVFQQYNLLPSLTAAENVAVPLIIAGVPRREAVGRAQAVLETVGLAEKLRSLPRELSGGQQQRVAIARALVHRPRLLVCDEPTAALDADSGRRVMRLLREATVDAGRAVIVVTHDNRVHEFGDRIVEMSDGRVVSVRGREGTPGGHA